MEVRVLNALPSSGCPEKDYVRVHTCSDPADDTVTLATIERVIDKSKSGLRSGKRVKKLIERQPMSVDAAVDLATSYAERKQIAVVYADASPAAAAEPWSAQ